jgi:hypothetical protein
MPDLKCRDCGIVASYADANIIDNRNEGCDGDGKCNWKQV